MFENNIKQEDTNLIPCKCTCSLFYKKSKLYKKQKNIKKKHKEKTQIKHSKSYTLKIKILKTIGIPIIILANTTTAEAKKLFGPADICIDHGHYCKVRPNENGKGCIARIESKPCFCLFYCKQIDQNKCDAYQDTYENKNGIYESETTCLSNNNNAGCIMFDNNNMIEVESPCYCQSACEQNNPWQCCNWIAKKQWKELTSDERRSSSNKNSTKTENSSLCKNPCQLLNEQQKTQKESTTLSPSWGKIIVEGASKGASMGAEILCCLLTCYGGYQCYKCYSTNRTRDNITLEVTSDQSITDYETTESYDESSDIEHNPTSSSIESISESN